MLAGFGEAADQIYNAHGQAGFFGHFTLGAVRGRFVPADEAAWKHKPAAGAAQQQITILFVNDDSYAAKRGKIAAKAQVENIKKETGQLTYDLVSQLFHSAMIHQSRVSIYLSIFIIPEVTSNPPLKRPFHQM